jgi:hypothetical protein
MRLFLALVFSFCSIQMIEASDLKADKQILDILHSKEFSNSTVQYEFQGFLYPILIIHNPNNEYLWGNGNLLSGPSTVSLLLVANVPFELMHDLEKLISSSGVDILKSYIDFRELRSRNQFIGLRPVHIGQTIDDPILDARAKEIFNSKEFINEIFYYYIDNRYYQIRLVHNPKKLTYVATRDYRLLSIDPLKPITIKWSKRYGIFAQYAQPELTNHLGKLIDASYKDWYLSCQIENGTQVTHQPFGSRYIYELDTWFDYTADLRLKN